MASLNLQRASSTTLVRRASPDFSPETSEEGLTLLATDSRQEVVDVPNLIMLCGYFRTRQTPHGTAQGFTNPKDDNQATPAFQLSSCQVIAKHNSSSPIGCG